MPPLADNVLHEIARRVRAAEARAERAALIAGAAGSYGISVGHLRRRLKKDCGVDFGYARRRDAGKPRDPARDAAADAVATLLVKAAGDMPTWRAIDVARGIGLIDPDCDLPAHYVDRYMRREGIERRAPKGPRICRQIDWGEPGHTTQVDSTNCRQWFVVDEAGRRIRFAEDWEVNRNKPNKTPPIIRYAAVDPPSGCFRVKYYQVAGETADHLLDFLWYVMQPGPYPQQCPMSGVFDVLVLDKGPGNMSAACKNVCDELGIDHRAHATGHSWAKGAVEKFMDTWQRALESELRLWPAGGLDELNERAEAFAAKYCATHIHRRTKRTPAEVYAEYRKTAHLPPPYERYCEAAATARVRRTVNARGLIEFEGRDYSVRALEGIERGKKVFVWKCVLDWDEAARPVRVALEAAPETVVISQALTRNGLGYVEDADLRKDRRDAAIEARDAGRELRLAAPLPPGPPAVGAASLPEVEPPEIVPPLRVAPRTGPAYPRTRALRKLVDAIGRALERHERAALGWGGQVTQSQIDAAVASLTQEILPGAANGAG